jgi:hypothetical protein
LGGWVAGWVAGWLGDRVAGWVAGWLAGPFFFSLGLFGLLVGLFVSFCLLYEFPAR